MKFATGAAVLVALAVVVCQPARADEESAKAQKLIDRAIEALGGAKALQKSKNSIIEDQGTFYGYGEGVPYQGRYVYVYGDPVRFRMEIVGLFVYVLDGDKGWTSTMGAVADLEGEALEVAKKGVLVSYAMSLIPLQKPSDAFKLTLADAATIDDEECEGIQIKHKDMPTITMHFSKKSGLVKKTRHVNKVAELGFQEAVEEAVFHEYKDFDGFKVPVKMTMLRDGKKLVESNPTKATFPDKIDDSEFKKPE